MKTLKDMYEHMSNCLSSPTCRMPTNNVVLQGQQGAIGWQIAVWNLSLCFLLPSKAGQ